jgi:hypothetical protein
MPILTQEPDKVDQENTRWLRQQIDTHGWLGKSQVGVSGAQNAWLLVQHADKTPEFQSQCLKLMTDALEGEVAPADIAYLTDRVLSAAGKPQRYGTQCELIDGKATVKDCESPDQLDQRRKQVGLPPMAEYLQQVQAMYGGDNK